MIYKDLICSSADFCSRATMRSSVNVNCTGIFLFLANAPTAFSQLAKESASWETYISFYNKRARSTEEGPFDKVHCCLKGPN